MSAPITLGERPLLRPETSASPSSKQGSSGVSAPGFGDQLRDLISETDAAQKQAAASSEAFASGKTDDIHGTMISLEQANISLRLLGNVRSRVIEAYREIMRMGA